MSTRQREKNIKLSTLVLLGIALIVISACGKKENKFEEEMAKCQKECDRINSNWAVPGNNQICLGCYPTSGKKILGKEGADLSECNKIAGKAEYGSNTSMAYSGFTTPASFTWDNVEDISAAAWRIGVAGTRIVTFRLHTGDTSLGTTRPDSLGLYRAFSLSLLENDFIKGPCGGEASVSRSGDPESDRFEGEIIFDSYCEANSTVSGVMRFYSERDSDKITARVSFSHFTIITDAGPFALDGAMDIRFINPYTGDITLNMLAQDLNADKAYWLKNYKLSLNSADEYTEVRLIDGTFFHPDYGHIMVFSDLPFQIHELDTLPAIGSLVAVDANGKSANLIAFPDDTYQILFDKGD